MSPNISFDPAIASLARTEARPSGTNSVRLLNRLSGTRNPNVAGDVAPVGSSAVEEPSPAVAKAHPSASAGDMLESLPDQDSARNPTEEEKRLELAIRSRIELKFRSDAQKARSAYDGGSAQQPRLDIRV